MDDEYTPELTEGRAKLQIQLSTCSICSRHMLKITSKLGKKLRELFPYYYGSNLMAQMSRADIVFRSNITDKDNRPICEQCAKEGKSTFICALCGKERSSDLKEDSFGDTPEFLCKICYRSVPAKVWDEKHDQLREAHRYDFD